MKISLAIEVEVKGLVARQHRLEEGEPAGRFPQSEMIDTAELPVCRNPEGSSPQSDDQPAADRLDAAPSREASNREKGGGLHGLAEISAGDDDIAGIVAGRLSSGCKG